MHHAPPCRACGPPEHRTSWRLFSFGETLIVQESPGPPLPPSLGSAGPAEARVAQRTRAGAPGREERLAAARSSWLCAAAQAQASLAHERRGAATCPALWLPCRSRAPRWGPHTGRPRPSPRCRAVRLRLEAPATLRAGGGPGRPGGAVPLPSSPENPATFGCAGHAGSARVLLWPVPRRPGARITPLRGASQTVGLVAPAWAARFRSPL